MKVLHDIFSILCHQYADRSAHYYNEIFPVCYRCAGLYFGFFSSFLFILIKGRNSYFSITKKTGIFLALFVLPWFIDGICNFFSLWSTSGALRSVSGMLCGIPLPLLLNFIQNNSGESRSWKKPGWVYFIIPIIPGSSFIFLLVFTQSFFIFYSLAIIATIAVLLFCLNMITIFFKVIVNNKVALSNSQLLQF